MIFHKIGHIFNPFNYPEFFGYDGYAQSPQALVLPDRVRIYFSVRKRDAPGKYISHVWFADFRKDFSGIIQLANRPVVCQADLGAFDEHGIFPFSPLLIDGRLLAYTCGWSRRYSVPVETSIGFAESYDGGLTFTRLGSGPIMSNSLHEPFLVGDAFVRKWNDQFHMWYIFGTRWIKNINSEMPERVYKIGHAVSRDGINFLRNSKTIIPDVIDENECQALPTVIYYRNQYHMVFCYRNVVGFREDKTKSYRLGYAVSDDLVNWSRRDDELKLYPEKEDEWDSEMKCYPNLFECDGKIYLLYNGNMFGKQGFGLAVLTE